MDEDALEIGFDAGRVADDAGDEIGAPGRVVPVGRAGAGNGGLTDIVGSAAGHPGHGDALASLEETDSQ